MVEGRYWSKRALLAGFLFLLVAVAFVGISQHLRYQRERRPLERRHHDSRDRLEMAKVASARLDEFRDEFTKRESELADLRRKFPSEMAVEPFLGMLEEWAGASGVSVEAHDVEIERNEFYEEARIPIVLHGKSNALSALMEKRDEISRFVLWTDAERNESAIHVQLRIFAGDFSREEKPHPCSVVEPPTTVWLWPYAGKLKRMRAELDELCDESSRLKQVDDKIQEYQRILHESEVLSRLIEQLKGEGVQ
jgi:Tfp pilus assembly protein PilO